MDIMSTNYILFYMFRSSLNIISIFIVFIIILIFFKLSNDNVVYVKSDIDGVRYLVRDEKDKKLASNLLSKIWMNMNKLKNHLISIKSNVGNDLKYINQLSNRMKNSIISESDGNTVYTSYTINKGEQIVFCLRSRAMMNVSQLHTENLMMYVAIHEMAHVGCPEKGHTPLFKHIFAFFIQESIKIGIYKYEDYSKTPVEYCGMTVSDNII
jgi:predicted metal-dependent hydrolase